MTSAVATPSRVVNIQTPRAFVPLLKPKKRYRGAWGGRGGGKSWFFAELLIDRFLERPALRAVCVREFQKSLEMSAKRLIEDIIGRYQVNDYFRVLNTHIETPQGGIILFQGMATHTADSIKSLEGFSIAWIEEAQNISQRSLDLLRPTIREEGSEIWASWNPNQPSDPIDRLLRDKDHPLPDAAVVGVNYDKNPWFPDVLRSEMEWDKRRDPEKYAHVWLGQYERHSEARVFRNWTVEEFESPERAEFLLGADWGFSIDPTVLFRGWVDGRKLYIDREVYKVGCEIDHTPAFFDSLACGKSHVHDYDFVAAGEPNPEQCERFARPWPIIADSARPETISYMQRHGYPRIKPARKGEGSLEEGINFLKTYDIVVHPRCRHAIDELTMYSYKTHKLTGEVIPILDDKKNHVIDALRYSVESLRHDLDGFVTW